MLNIYNFDWLVQLLPFSYNMNRFTIYNFKLYFFISKANPWARNPSSNNKKNFTITISTTCMTAKSITTNTTLLESKALQRLKLVFSTKKRFSTELKIKHICENIQNSKTWFLYFCLKCLKKSPKTFSSMQENILINQN